MGGKANFVIFRYVYAHDGIVHRYARVALHEVEMRHAVMPGGMGVIHHHIRHIRIGELPRFVLLLYVPQGNIEGRLFLGVKRKKQES